MRIIPLFISGVLTLALVLILNTTWVLPAPLGKLLSPQQGVWQNAEPVNQRFDGDLSFPQLKGKTEVYFDERLVPHVFAENSSDAYFVQGYLHAKFRLWQMEFQTHAAGGRLSEIVGTKALGFDRDKRRLGMVYAAELSLKEIEKDPNLLEICNQYTAGVNAYIESLTESSMPLEYKLLGYKPEKWTNLKSALFTKYMALDLAGYENDFEMTNAKSVFSQSDFEKLYPIAVDSLDPIVPKGTIFPKPGVEVKTPANADSVYFNYYQTNTINQEKPNPDNGSNNWAVAGSKTKSGYPILANDPHLGLNLPSIWYEMQIHTPDYNAYGASFPGAPFVIIGFNDSCAFGFTNAMRDVKDFYEIQFKDDSRKEYWFDNKWNETKFRVEKIKIKDSLEYNDTVAYTNIGPVMYDKSFDGSRNTNQKYYAVRWSAHDANSELKIFMGLNSAKNYDDYLTAIKHLGTPGQNVVFASKSGDIALWDQGVFPAKWRRQGDFVMPGDDSNYFWQGMIPQEENPHQFNPERGFVSSANQLPTDTTYPYYLGGNYPPYRGWEINKMLHAMDQITPQDMMELQTNNYNVFGEMALPVLVQHINTNALDGSEQKYFEILKNWDHVNAPTSKGATVFSVVWDSLEVAVWEDEISKSGLKLPWPHESTLLESLLKDTSYSFIDNINTPEKETLEDVMTSAFKKAVKSLAKFEKDDKLEWAKFKDTRVLHLSRLEELSRLHLPIGGGKHTINAANAQHGPSWRMIVSLTPQTEAYGIYPGGQSGNPGSKFYDNFITDWALGKYYPLWVMKPSETSSNLLIGKITFNKK